MKIGLSSYTIRHDLADDPLGMLEKISASGYRALEFCNDGADIYPESGGRFNVDMRKFKEAADSRGIKLIGSLVMPHNLFDADTAEEIYAFYDDIDLMKRIFEFNRSIGGDHVTVGISFYPTKDHLLRRCEAYNKLGEISASMGIRLLYHNHYHEFQKFGDDTIFDLIWQNTAPEYLGLNFDAYWCFRGACDPVKKMKEYGDRIGVLHVKDFPFEQVRYIDSWTMRSQTDPIITPKDYMDIVRPEFSVELGDGMIKVQDIIDTGNMFNIPYVLVEQDATSLPSETESMQRSAENMRRLQGFTWE